MNGEFKLFFKYKERKSIFLERIKGYKQKRKKKSWSNWHSSKKIILCYEVLPFKEKRSWFLL